MKKVYSLILSACFCFAMSASAQVVVNTGFENGGSFPPPGWTTTGNTTYLAAISGTGGNPTISGPHGGTYSCRLNSYSLGSNQTAQLISPVVNWAARGATATTVTIWWWRDVAAYNTSTYDLEGVTAYVNTSPSLTGATSMGYVPRRGGASTSGGVSGTATTTTSGWYQYTFTVPTSFNTATNYIIFNFYSMFGNNCFMDDVQYTEYPPACSGTPSAGTVVSSTTSGCGFYTSNLSMSGATFASGINYQWQSSPNNSTWTDITGATNSTTTVGVSANTYFRCRVTCTNSSITVANSGVLHTLSSGPSYATLPYSESFESWSNRCSTTDVPSAFWVGVPASSNQSWRRNDQGSSASWTGPTSGAYTPASALGTYSARFHTYNASSGTSGSLNLFVNLPAGTKNISYQYRNTSGTDALLGQVSTDGGGTFTTIDAPPIIASSWTMRSFSFTTAAAPTAIIRFVATSDFGVTDIGLDDFNISCGLPAITGSLTTCVGAVSTLGNATSGGVWSSTNTGVATINSSSGQLTGVAVGTTTISYVAGGCSATGIVTVNAVPSVTVSATPATICPTFSSTLTATSTNPGASGYNVNSITFAPVSFTPTATYNGTTTPSSGNNDDGYYTGTLPFNFSLFGVNYTAGSSFYMVTNGYITFGAGYTGLTMGTMPNTLYPAMIGLFSRDMDLRTTGSITWGVTGTTPNQKLIISYNAVPVYNSPTLPLTGQIVIYEGSGNIELHITESQGTNHTTGTQNSGGSQFTAIPGHNNTTTGISNQAWSLIVPAPSFTWSPATNLSSTTSASPVAGPLSTTTTYTVTATASNGCPTSAPVTVNVNPSPLPISGSPQLCLGVSSTLTNTGGGTWSSSNSAVAPIGSASGIVTGASLGTATITYTLPTGCTRTMAVTVNPLPSAIGGLAQACPGTSSTLTNSGGGTWTSAGPGIATVGSASGVVTGVTAGNTVITYTLPTGCTTTQPFTVNPTPAAITGTFLVCPGSTVSLSDASPGGSWTSGNTSTAIVGSSTGIVTGVASGVTTITYTLPTTCITTSTFTVNTTAPITGSFGICTGFSSTLSNSISGGVWTSSNPAIASVGSSSGVVFGVSAGPAVITYTFPNGCTETALVGVTATPSTYAVTGGGNYCAGGAGVAIGVSGSNPGVSYQLYLGGIATGSAVLGTGLPVNFGLQTAAGTYTVIANPGSPCATTMSSSATIVIYPAPTAHTVTGGGAYCAGGTGVNVSLSGSNSGISYQLFNGVTAVGAPLSGTGTILNFGLQTAPGTYTVVGTNTTTLCTGNMTGSVTVTINPLPAVYSMTGTAGYCADGTGVPVGLSNSAVGVNYQLYRGGIPVGSPVAGTGVALSFGMQTVAGTYTAMATNATTGCTNAMSGAAVVTINPLPTLFTVTGGGSFCTGGTGVTIGLSGSTVGVNYQLYNGATLMGTISGTGSALTSPLINITGTYTVVAVNASTGCTRTMIGSATITTNPLPGTFTVTGGGAYCSGDIGLPIGLSGSVIGTNYYLYNGTTIVDGASGTTAPLDFGLFTAPGTYTIMAVLPGTGCSALMSGFATISIKPLPLTYTVTGGGSLCAGGTGFNVGLSGSQSGVLYKLANSTGLVGTFTGTGSSFNFGTYTDPDNYTVVAADPVSFCTRPMTGSVAIIENPLPVAYAVTGGGNYCIGGTGVNVGLASSDAGVNYQLYIGASPTGSAVAGTGSAISFGLKTATGVYTVRATNAVTGCLNNMSGSVTVGTNMLPAVYTVTGGGNYCAGGTGVHVMLGNSETGVNYQLWRRSTMVGAPMAGTSGSSIDFGLQTAAGSYSVTAANPVTGCNNNMTGSATIAIDPLPVVMTVTGGGSYCTGGAGTHVGLSGSISGTSYQLYNGISPVGSPVAGSGFAIDFGAQTATGTYTVSAIEVATGCANNMSGTAAVGINSLPAPYPLTGGGSFCAGGTGVNVGIGSSTSGVNYQLSIGGVPVGSPLSGTGTMLNFGLQTATGIYTVSAVDVTTGCTNNMPGSAMVAVNPAPTAYSLTGGGNYCPGGAGVPVGLSNSQPGVTYQLFNGTALAGTVSGTGGAIGFGPMTSTGVYTVVATNNTTGCTQTMPGSVAVGISMLPNPYNVTGGGNYCPGGTGVHVGVSGSDTWMSYSLYNGTTMIGSAITGTGGPIDFGVIATPGTYTVVANGVGTSGCTGNMTGAVIVGLNTPPVAHSVTGGGNYCTGGTGVSVGLSWSDLNVSYALYLAGSPVGSPMAGTGAALDFGLQTGGGLYTIVATDNMTSCTTNMIGGVAVTLDPLPTVFTLSGGGAYCAGGAGVPVVLSSSSTGTTYSLYRNGSLFGTPASGTGTALDFGLQTAAGTYTIEATTTATGCLSAMSGSVAVNILPLPSAYGVTGGGDFCSGGAGVHVMLSNSNSGVSYQLYNGITASGSPMTGSGSSIDFGARTAAGVYTVVATDGATGCTSNMMSSALINELPLPNAYTVSGSSSGYCIGGAGVTVSLGGSDAGVNYQLYRGTTLVGLPIPGTGAMISFGPQTIAGTYTVVGVRTATGCSNSMFGAAGVSINPLPGAFTVTGGGSFCAGGSGVVVGLSGSNSGVNYQLYKTGIPVGSPVSGTGSSISFGAQVAAGNYTVVATNAATGCTNAMTGSATISVNSLPSVQLVSGGGTLCAGGTGVLVGLTGSVIGISYQLKMGTAMVGAPVSGTGGAITFGMHNTGGTYTVVATNTTTGCTNNMGGSATVNVNPAPTAYTVTGGGGFCAGGTGVHVGIGGSALGMAYQLYNGTTMSGIAVAGTGGSIDFGLKTAAGTYTIVARDVTTGCTANMTGSATVIINPLPAVYAVTGGGSFCAGGTGVHIGVGNSATGVDYNLYTGGGMVTSQPGSGTAVDFGTISGGGSYTVIAVNHATGCASNMTGSATVVVNPVVTPAVTISTGVGDTVCSGVFTNLTALTTNGGLSPTYQWSINGVPVGGTGNSYTYFAVDGDVVRVVMTSTAACAAPAIVSHMKTLTVNNPELPSVVVSANPGTTVCQGATANFTAVAAFGGTSPVYKWMKNGTQVGSSATYSYIPANGDVVKCVLMSNYRCRLQDSAVSTTMNMTTQAPVTPVVNITANPGLNIGAGQLEVLTANVTSGGTGHTYQWQINGADVPGATFPVYQNNTYANLDVVTCKVWSGGVCSGILGTSNVTIHVHGVGVQQVTQNGITMTVVPNPNKGTFFVKGNVGVTSGDEVVIEITNMLGQSIYTNKVLSVNGEVDAQVVLGNNIANGMYILNVHAGNENKVFHIVVEQ